MFSSIAAMIKSMQHSSNSSRTQPTPFQSAAKLGRRPQQTRAIVSQPNLPVTTAAPNATPLSKRELLQTLLSKIQELERVEQDSAQFLENSRAMLAPAAEVTAPLPQPVPKQFSVHPAPAGSITGQGTAPREVGGDDDDDSKADRFKAPPVTTTHEAAVGFEMFHAEHPATKHSDPPKRSHRGSRRITLQFETERQVQSYLAEFERCRNLRELRFNDRGAELHQLIER